MSGRTLTCQITRERGVAASCGLEQAKYDLLAPMLESYGGIVLEPTLTIFFDAGALSLESLLSHAQQMLLRPPFATPASSASTTAAANPRAACLSTTWLCTM